MYQDRSLNLPAPISTILAPETPKNPSEINGSKTAKIQDLCGPRHVIETELGRWRDWEQVVSTNGVVSDCTFVGKDVVAKCGFGKLAVFRDLGFLNKQ